MSRSRRRKGDVPKVNQSDVDFQIAFYQNVLETSPDFVEALTALGHLYTKKGWYKQGLMVDEKLAELRPENPYIFYNLACSYALLDNVPQAMSAIEKAVDLGFSDIEHLEEDDDLANMVESEEGRSLIDDLKNKISQQIVHTRRVSS